MKAMKRLGQGMLVAITVLGLAGAASAGPKLISSCKTIDEPGSYLVTRNLAATFHCLVISARDVTIDLGGYVLSGNGTGTGVTANLSRAGISVRNGTVKGFQNGINLVGPGGIVDQVRAHDNAQNGIIAGPGSIVRASVARDNGDDGIYLYPAGQVTGSVATGNGFRGIVVECPSSAIANTAIDNVGGNLVTQGAGCFLSQNLAP